MGRVTCMPSSEKIIMTRKSRMIMLLIWEGGGEC